MGELLRRYWQPIAAVAEFDDTPTKPVRLMGEDLVLYKDLSGHYGLVDRHCPHRRADLSYGIVEACGLRCNYHGWLFDETGACLEQPFEDIDAPEIRFRDQIRISAYPVEAKAGLLWAYLGPEPAPLVPNWEPFTWENGFVQIVFADDAVQLVPVPGELDRPGAFRVDARQLGRRAWRGDNGAYAPRHLKLAFDEFDYGIVYRRVREDSDETRRAVDRRARLPVAERAVHRQPLRMARADRRYQHAERRLVLHPRAARSANPIVQKRIPYWYSPDRRRRRPGAGSPATS